MDAFASEYYEFKERQQQKHAANCLHENVKHHRGCYMCRGAPYRREYNRIVRSRRRSSVAHGIFEFEQPRTY
jgi:hypothetical protein